MQVMHLTTILVNGLLALLPFGVAMQNIVMALVFGYLVAKVKVLSTPLSLNKHLGRAVMAITGMVSVTAWASAINLIHAPGSVSSYLLGHVSFYGLPLIFLLLLKDKRACLSDRKSYSSQFLSFVSIGWLCVILSQWLWGWKVSGVHIVFDDAYKRARGFYSHPLTLAYVALITFPAVLYYFRKNPRSILAWCLLTTQVAALYFSMSRTAQFVGGILIVWFILMLDQIKTRIFFLLGLIVLAVAILMTPNLISQRLKNIMEGNQQQWSEEKESHYADDRLAFWQAHWEMIKERPFLGHGAFLDSNYRKSYYTAIGLPGFKKSYEAHNQYLQILTEGGILAFGFFVGWLYYLVKWCKTLPHGLSQVGYQTIFCFLAGGMTQNAFHDSEVRYAMMCVILLGIMTENFKNTSEKMLFDS